MRIVGDASIKRDRASGWMRSLAWVGAASPSRPKNDRSAAAIQDLCWASVVRRSSLIR
jgi:hypothetical protein